MAQETRRGSQLQSVSMGWGVSSRPLGGMRRGLRVDVLPDLRQLVIPNVDVEDPVVLVRPTRFDFPRSDADKQNIILSERLVPGYARI